MGITGHMKVVVDNKIPYIREVIEQLADEVCFLPGNGFTREAVRDADALIVRTRTRCDRALLEGSRVRFIATATIGYDHIDTDYCRRAGITWRNAPGCNSGSVAQYLRSALLLLQEVKGIRLEGRTLGVVGVGNVGSKVARVGRELGMRVLLNDPPRAEQAGATDEEFYPLERLAEACDVISLHTPLCRDGQYATYHLADEAFFRSLRRQPVLVNTSRGEVVDTHALLKALEEGNVSEAIIDVWEGEPEINRTLLYKTFLGTPHIAGYSADGKANATRMALDAFCRFFGIEAHYRIAPPEPDTLPTEARNATEAYLRLYDPRRDSEALKRHPEQFEQLRGNYPLRREGRYNPESNPSITLG